MVVLIFFLCCSQTLAPRSCFTNVLGQGCFGLARVTGFDQFQCWWRNSNVPRPLMTWPLSKNSMAISSANLNVPRCS